MTTKTCIVGMGISLIAATATVAQYWKPQPGRPACYRRPIDLVICLDTSGSMTGLLDSARARLWDIVNQLGRARPTPSLRIGLLTYGSPRGSSAHDGWVIQQSNLTTDLDTVYAKLMTLTTDGGNEYVGWVLHDALRTMSWSSDPSALKMIFVAGNESADQGQDAFNFRYVAEEARAAGIIINAIYCGNNRQGTSERWHEVASHGGGSYSAIDMQCGTAQITTPYDQQLMDLNKKLNDTYVAYGAKGEAGRQNQQAQDANAERLGRQSCGARVTAKAQSVYTNGGWDLVDAADAAGFKLEQVSASDLPPNMQSMPIAERQAYIDGMRRAREAVRQEINEVGATRDRFLETEQKKTSSGAVGLDAAMLGAIREQAQAKGFSFDSGC